MNRWSKNGVLDQVFELLQREQIVRIKIEAVKMDSTIVKVHPGRHRRVKKNGPQAIGKSRGGWTTKIHMVAANARTAITFALSPGQASDAVAGRELLGGIGPLPAPLHLIMDGAYEDNETRQLALDFGFIPVVPPKSNRLNPGSTTRLCTANAMRSRGSSADSKASAASSPASKNSMSSSSASSPSL